jgi:site-specific DNA-methyltransferase (adenine-specific)
LKIEKENYTLYLGDCLDIMPDLEQVDAVITDVPYGTIACSWDVIIPFNPMWERIEAIRKKRTAVALFSKKPFTAKLINSNIEAYKYDWVWEKPKASGYASVKHRPMSAHEEINIFYPHNYYPQMSKGKPYKQPRKKQNYDNTMNGAFKVRADDFEFKDNNGTRFPRSVLQFRNSYYDDGKQVHPTQKPTSLMRYLCATYSKPEEIVMDFTMGSGSTGVACAQLGRKFIGIEIDPDYFGIAAKRIEAAYAQMTMF